MMIEDITKREDKEVAGRRRREEIMEVGGNMKMGVRVDNG